MFSESSSYRQSFNGIPLKHVNDSVILSFYLLQQFTINYITSTLCNPEKQ